MKSLLHTYALLFLLPFYAPGLGAAPAYDEGIEYQRIEPAQATDNKNKVEVVELFWYGCPHCFHLEKDVSHWLKTKPDYVQFTRVPAVLNPHWELHARAYYAAEALGVLNKIHKPFFSALHEQRQPLNTTDQIVKWVSGLGVSGDKFRTAMQSFSVEMKVRRAKQLGDMYGINGVPSIIVNGKYRTSAGLAGSNEELFKVVDYLVAKEHAPQKAQ